MNLAVGFQTDTGRVRDANQDSYAVLRGKELGHALDGLFVVADGMGGVGGGEVASGIVAQSLPDAVHEALHTRNGHPLDTRRLLRDTIVRANAAVWQHKAQHQELRRMGTTCVVAIIRDNTLTIGNVGDSRAYLLRQGRLRQLTEDHSQIWEEVRAGRMTREEARTARFRNVITRGMGLGPEVVPDVEEMPLQEGDTVLLCSDGLTTEVSDTEIASLLASVPDAQEAADLLVETALRNGGSDNITVVVLRYGTFLPSAVAVVEDDEDTDPNQSWRHARTRTNGHRSIEEERFYEEPVDVSAGSHGSLGMRIGLLCLALVAIGEAAALYMVYAGSLKLRPERKPVPPAPVTKPTDSELDYGVPALVYAGPLLDSYLQIEPTGNLLVVGVDGKLRRITPQGKEQPVLNGGVTVPLRPQMDRDGNPLPLPAAPRVPFMALDASGNRYLTRPVPKAIYKYNRDDTRVADNIGRGYLKAPSAIAVAPNGDLYVIDARQLKRLAAHLDTHKPGPGAAQQSRLPANRPAAPDTANP